MLAGKVIIVTGGSGLIGQAVVARARAAGGTVLNADVHVETDWAAGTLHCDVTDEASVKAAFEAVAARYGGLHGLVNSAYPRTGDWVVPFEELTVASWRRNIDLQLTSVFLCCQQALRHMQAQPAAAIVNVGSIYGIVGPDFSIYEGTTLTTPGPYPAIKGGVIAFTRFLAAHYGPAGIRVNCVSPGGILNKQAPSFIQNYERKVPLGRMGYPEDIAPAVAFLLSDEAAYITGHNLLIDGGWTCV